MAGARRNYEEVSSGNQRCHSGEALTEWRSSELIENEVPSTSPPFWDMDDDNDGGQRTSQLYGKYTWTINDFSKINKRELRSNAFEVGGYKWYILIYPKGCDVCNHLSLFLCVANHDKLLPGWSHFAQFTIAVVNKDPKRTKYSDTLHRFWKKEHDWGWKKFMELSKVMDGFIDANSLIIKVQIQVIRERADRPFRCLGCQYRRELIRVYLTNVETICRRFVEARRTKFGKLIEDKAGWTSFCTFWSGIDQNTKHLISREKSDAVLRAAVKHFFVVKEVSSTLVMDSLYSGLKCLESMSKNKRNKEKLTNTGELVVPMVLLEKDMFIIVDDVLPIAGRAAIEPLPPKDDKGPQIRTKDGCSGEDVIKDSVEYDERRLTELGRRTIEIFALENIFSKIEIAYQEAVSLKRQEELIREEEAEAAFLAGSEHKAKRGIEREKKSKKKQAKHKRKGRKATGGKGTDEKTHVLVVVDELQEISDPHGSNEFTLESGHGCEKTITIDALSDSSDSLDCVTEALQLDSEDRGSSPVCRDTGTSDILPLAESIISDVTILDSSQNGKGERKIPSSIDDSSLTSSTDSLPSVVRNGSHREYLQTSQGTPKQPVRNDTKANSTCWTNNDLHGWPSETVIDSARLCDAELDSVPQSFPEHLVKKEEVAPPQRNLSKGIPSKETKTRCPPPICPPQNLATNNVSVGKPPMSAGPTRCTSKPHLVEAKEPKPIQKPSVQQVPVIPSFQTPRPLLNRSVSAAGRLGSEPSASAPAYFPQLSHRNAIIGVSDSFPQYYPSDLGPQSSIPITRNPSIGMMRPPHSSAMPTQSRPPHSSAMPTQSRPLHSSAMPTQSRPLHSSAMPTQSRPPHSSAMPTQSRPPHSSAMLTQSRPPYSYAMPTQSRYETERQTTQNASMLEFPHLDIINDLLDEENGMGRVSSLVNNQHHNLNRQFTFPGYTRMWGGDTETSSTTTNHDYVSSPLTHFGQLDREYQRRQHGFVGNQWQNGETEVTTRMGMRNNEPDGLSHGGIHDYHSPPFARFMYRGANANANNGYGGANANNGYGLFRPSNGH